MCKSANAQIKVINFYNRFNRLQMCVLSWIPATAYSPAPSVLIKIKITCSRFIFQSIQLLQLPVAASASVRAGRAAEASYVCSPAIQSNSA